MTKNKQNARTIADVISKRRSKLRTRAEYRSLLFRIIVLVLAGYLFFTQVFLITQVSGLGMFPALKDGDLVVAFRLQQEYVKDDVIVYTVDGVQYSGRFTASENDVVLLDDSETLRVNGAPQGGEILYPSYAKEGLEYPYRVPEGHVFVMGDYRTQTLDSRDFAAIPMDDVQGKVITILRRRGL